MPVLEVMSGRHVLDLADPSEVVLITDWAWALVKAGRAREVLTEALRAPMRQPPWTGSCSSTSCAHSQRAGRPCRRD
jgi:hypothetical protein